MEDPLHQQSDRTSGGRCPGALAAVTCLVLLGAAFGAPAVPAVPPDNPVRPEPSLAIQSVLSRPHDVLATDGTRLFRANRGDRTWRHVPTPARMPLRGVFGPSPAPADLLFFYTPRSDSHGQAIPAADQSYGLWKSNDGGGTWELATDVFDFRDVFWHPDGKLYAVTAAPADAKRLAILRSADRGKSWEDITHGLDAPVNFTYPRLSQNPDRPHLVCLRYQGAIRGVLAYAEDDKYVWKTGRDVRRPVTEADFLGTNFRFSGIESISDYTLQATFGTYFEFPFGDSTHADPFGLVTDKAAYDFPLNGPKPVRVTMQFRREDHPAAIMDLPDKTDFWGVRIVDPDGNRITIVPEAARRANERTPKDAYQQAEREYAEKPGLRKIELVRGKDYERAVDLDKLFTFPRPGTYKVQLTYACPWWAGEGRAKWTGGFGGPAMTVTVK